MTDSYDLAVIGAGPAGTSAAEVAATFGRRAVVIERTRPGGVVTTTGGAPTKTLREAALYLTGFGLEEVYGVRQALPLAETMAIIEKRVLQGARPVAAHRRRAAGRARCRLPAGGAVLGRDGGIIVTPADRPPRRIMAEAVVVATGSRPARPAGIPFDDPDVYDTDEIHALRTIPSDAVVVGAVRSASSSRPSSPRSASR